MELNFKVERIDGQSVTLAAQDGGRQILWPLDLLPSPLAIGDILIFNIGAEKERQHLAKEILNEILRVDSAAS